MLAVVDTSGSMYYSQQPMPAAVALSLGIYLAERNTGSFKNHFIEFSDNPTLIELKGETFADKLRYVASFNEIGSTNLESVFKLILTTAVKNNISQENIPTKLIMIIISDMEFNRAIKKPSLTNLENAKQMFMENGYKLQEVVFWNVENRNRNVPVRKDESGVALVSGCTPKLFEMIAGGITTPQLFMEEILNSKRYAQIVA